MHSLKLPIAPGTVHTWNAKEVVVRNLHEFNAVWQDRCSILYDRWPEHRLSSVAMKATNYENKALLELVEKSRNEANIVTNIYLIVLICLYCISFHNGKNPIFNGQLISDNLSAKNLIVLDCSSSQSK